MTPPHLLHTRVAQAVSCVPRVITWHCTAPQLVKPPHKSEAVDFAHTGARRLTLS